MRMPVENAVIDEGIVWYSNTNLLGKEKIENSHNKTPPWGTALTMISAVPLWDQGSISCLFFSWQHRAESLPPAL